MAEPQQPPKREKTSLELFKQSFREYLVRARWRVMCVLLSV